MTLIIPIIPISPLFLFALLSFLSNKKGVPKNTFFHYCFTHERSSLKVGFLPCIKIPTR